MPLSSGKSDTVDRMLTPGGIPTVKVHCPLTEVTLHPVPVAAPITSFLLYLGFKSIEMNFLIVRLGVSMNVNPATWLSHLV